MNPIEIIKKYYNPDSKAYELLLAHSQAVANKALKIGKKFPREVDLAFLEEASLLHDIGMFKTNAPDLGCHGDKPYLQHGILGREILEKEGYPKHGLVCERHVGAGIDTAEIKKNNLPLPERDMVPQTLEEEIIAYADKFFSKSIDNISKEKSIEKIIAEIEKYDESEVRRFKKWHEKFT